MAEKHIGEDLIDDDDYFIAAHAFLAQGLSNCMMEDCLIDAIHASSTDNYPEESILNTLKPGDRIGRRASYWSSGGENDPTVPETLTYKLISKLCLI
ncbi:hypothetical protein RND71_030132 [Anisodus tanguticus]|uniref:Uncharacterized protein n=1 Tax=Anisodus tanguticus TaxID=243964 RepID=A0AAE1REP5_9SOLA|nr:hypothetical protein RND71_030132 [Anisodus tanguticus]